MGHAEGDRKRSVILNLLKGYPEGLPVVVIARKCRIWEPNLARYHLRILANSGQLVCIKGPGKSFLYRLPTEEESRTHDGA